MRACTVEREKKHRAARSRKSLLYRRLAYVAAAMVALIIIGLLVYSLSPKSPSIIDRTPKIAIVDHLSAMWPDPEFNRTIQGILNQTRLKVDYYPSEDVTVDFYRNLPLHNYKLIIFRVHSTATCSVKGQPPFVVLFTSENYSSMAHVSEQEDMRVVYVKFPNITQLYFGITPTFVQNSMEGRFNDTVIIAMGCQSLNQTTMAEAFIQKGAKAYIGWNGSVSASYTDQATACLLRHLIVENQTIKEAVNETMNEVGPDPSDKSILMFYPDKAGTCFLFANATIATPKVRTAKKNTNKIDENSGTPLVPLIFTS
jgi:hypothetical protein